MCEMNPDLPCDTEILICTEVTDGLLNPTEEEINEYAQRIGIDSQEEPDLLYIAQEGIQEKLPASWKPCLDTTKNCFFYFNKETLVCQWEHPMDSIYRDKVIKARADLAINRPIPFVPINMQLPPVKRSAKNISRNLNGLGSLGGFESGLNSNSITSDSLGFLSPLNSLEGHNNANSKNIISGSTLNTHKDVEEDDDDTPPFIRPTRKLGLTLTGGGANFMKGSNTSAFDMLGKPSAANLSNSNSNPILKGERETTPDSDDTGKSEILKAKPVKSILINSRPRNTNVSDNVYELDGFSMNMNEMTEEEKLVLSQLDSLSLTKSKGNSVKFNLDDDAELKFEMPDISGDVDDDIDDEVLSVQAAQPSPEPAEEAVVEPFVEPVIEPATEPATEPSYTGSLASNESKQPINKIVRDVLPTNTVPAVPEYLKDDIWKTKIRNEMDEQLKQFIQQLDNERYTRQEQMQKHYEETLERFMQEKLEAVRKVRIDVQEYTALEIEKAKRDLDFMLQGELQNMKVIFDNELHERHRELEKETEKRVADFSSECQKREEERISSMMTAFRRSEEEKVAELRKTPSLSKTASVMDSQNQTDEVPQSLSKIQKIPTSITREVPKPSQIEAPTEREEDTTHPTQDDSESAVDFEQMKTTMRKEMEAELRKFREQLMAERKSRKQCNGTLSRNNHAKDETIKRIQMEVEEEKALELEKVKREVSQVLEQELEEMKTKFWEEMQMQQKELEEENLKKYAVLQSEYLRKEEAAKRGNNVDKRQSIDLNSDFDDHQRIIENAKTFIRMQKNLLKEALPANLLVPDTKENGFLLDQKMMQSASSIPRRRPALLQLELLQSETDSSGISSLKDHRSSESKQLSRDIDNICKSLTTLDQQMKLMWSVVNTKQAHPSSYRDDTLSYFNVRSNPDLAALLPNTVPLRTSTTIAPNTILSLPRRNLASSSLGYSNSPASTQNAVATTMKNSDVNCTDMLQSLDDELRKIQIGKNRLLDMHKGAGLILRQHENNFLGPGSIYSKQNNSNILEKTKYLQDWLQKP